MHVLRRIVSLIRDMGEEAGLRSDALESEHLDSSGLSASVPSGAILTSTILCLLWRHRKGGSGLWFRIDINAFGSCISPESRAWNLYHALSKMRGAHLRTGELWCGWDYKAGMYFDGPDWNSLEPASPSTAGSMPPPRDPSGNPAISATTSQAFIPLTEIFETSSITAIRPIPGGQ